MNDNLVDALPMYQGNGMRENVGLLMTGRGASISFLGDRLFCLEAESLCSWAIFDPTLLCHGPMPLLSLRQSMQ